MNEIGPLSLTRLFPLLGKAHPKWWHETEIVKFDPKAVFIVWPRWEKLKKRVLNAIGRPSSTRLFPLLGKAHPKWWHETEIVKFHPKAVFFVWPRWEKLKKRVLKAIGRPSSTRLFPLLGKAHPKWWHETEIVKFDLTAVFFVWPRWEKLKKRVLNAIGRPSSTRLFPLLGKAHPKWWHETEIVKFEPTAVFFVWPRWEKLKKRVLNAIGRPSSTRLFPLLGKAHPKWWHETEIVKFDPKAVFSLRPDGES